MNAPARLALAAIAGGALTAGALAVTGERTPAPARAGTAPPAVRTVATTGGTARVALPAGWRVRADGPAATVLAGPSGDDVVVVRRRGRVRTDLPRLGRHLAKRLQRDLPGAEPAGTRTFATTHGEALVTTLVRGDRVHGVAVVPDGARSFSLDLVAGGRSPDGARALAAIVRSFEPARSSVSRPRRP